LVVIAILLAGGYFIFAQGGAPARPEDTYLEPANLAGLIEKKTEPYVLVDVRTAEEYSSGHIPGAMNIPYDIIASNLPTPDKNALVIVYCRSGNRSGIAKKTLESLGYSRVVNFGAVSKWPKELVSGNTP
jgi:rhodanese-related sulfurtransferase